MTDPLDDAIDGAVREMLDVEPRADLRARVIAQLPAFAESRAGKPASGSRLPALGWVLGSIAAVGVILLAVFVARRSEPIPPHPIVVARGTDTPLPMPSNAAVHPVGQSPLPGVPIPAARPTARVAAVVVAASSTGGDRASADISPLKQLAPINIAPIAQDSIAPAAIVVHPLPPIDDVQIAPLTPPDRRN